MSRRHPSSPEERASISAKRREYRLRRLASPPQPGHRWCARCMHQRPVIDFQTDSGQTRKLCRKCREWAVANANTEPERLRAYRRENQGVIQKRTADYLAARPLLMRTYKLKVQLDSSWLYGPPRVRRYLTNLGYTYADCCQTCGADTPLPQSYWPDHSEPARFVKLCPSHRKFAAYEDTRTASELNKARGFRVLGGPGGSSRPRITGGRAPGESNPTLLG